MPKRAILIANLGSPDSTSVADVRRFLREFLGDERVLDMAAPLRWLLLEGVILPTRPRRTAHAYSKVWTREGSPLVVTSESVRRELAAALDPGVPVFAAMRYGNPSIASTVAALAAQGRDDVLLIPQYPHYAMSSWETVVVRVHEEAARQAPGMRISCVQPFYGDPDYIEVLHTVASAYLAKPHDHLLFSYHGIPVRHLRKADSSRGHCTVVADCCTIAAPAHATCYRAQCVRMTADLARRAGLDPARYSMSFQSRLAGEPWLEPFTDVEFVRLAKAGVRRLLVICPSFVADCLETLEEISIAGRGTFLEAGGEQFEKIPCPNDHSAYIEFLANRVRKWLNGGTL
ncbi:MAG TPA: ferrochelatase [Opitutaceae bacterium]|nr:ferrochelatase [Opitutaceae bacterium]